MKRREFITLLGGAAAWPLAVRAQEGAKPRIIGFLGGTTSSDASQWAAAFAQRLRELGWIDGHSVNIQYRWAEGHDERAAEFAAEFVRLKVDVIVTYGTPTTVATKRVTSAVPIVVALLGDPVGSGLIASISRPGGNITDCRPSRTTSLASESKSYGRSCPISAGWRSWQI